MIEIFVFTSENCQPCKVQTKILEEIAQERKDLLCFEVPVHENREWVRKYGVRTSPTTIILKDGRQISDFKGLTLKETIIEAADNN